METLGIDYRASRTRQVDNGDDILLYDAKTNKTASFPAHDDEIVLKAQDARISARRKAALAWSKWRPRPFVICNSQHEFLAARMQTR